MEMLLEGDILGHLVRYTANDRIAGSQAEVVRLFASLTILLDERFLSRQAVHRPLVRLMRICVGDEFFGSGAAENGGSADPVGLIEDEERRAQHRFGRMGSAEMLGFEEQLVDLMCHVASRLRNSPELLIIFFRERGGDEDTRRAFNKAMAGSSVVPSRASTRAPSPTGTASPTSGLATRSSAPAVSSPLRPPESLPLPSSPHSAPKADVASQTSSSSGLTYDFPLFSYLMRFVHRESRTGELARAGILFLVDVAFAPGRRNLARNQANRGTFGRASGAGLALRATRSMRGGRRSGAGTPQKARVGIDLGMGPSIALARFMLESDFAEVLGAGIGAVYGLLPTKLVSSKVRRSGHDQGGHNTLLGQDEVMVLGENRAEEVSGDARIAGLATSNSEEVRGQARLLCDLLEFAQDLLRTTSRAALSDEIGLGIDDAKLNRPPVSQELSIISRSLSASMASAVQALFLENILYLSMLECSDLDRSSIAVMTYLEAMLSVLETENPLAERIVGWLVGRDMEIEGPDNFRERRPKRKSTAMMQLEKDKGNPGDRQSATYFSDALGRYTIRDLIVDNMQRSTAPMAITSALRLASTLFTFHGRFTLSNVIRVDFDDFATSFPTGLFMCSSQSESAHINPSDPANDDHDDDDEFIYPGGAKDDLQFESQLKKSASRTVRGASAWQFNSEMDAYLSLMTSTERTEGNRSPSRMTVETAPLSTGFDNYLDDAELGITQDSMYRITMRNLDDDPDALESGLRAVAAGGDGRPPARDCLRHKLNAHDRLLRNVLAQLCHFWQNQPEVNVALTGFIATVAMCPLRSLEGFLSFSRTERKTEEAYDQPSLADEGQIDDDRSDDERTFAAKITEVQKTGRASRPSKVADKAATADLPVVMCILRALVLQLDHHRSTIEEFDKYLSERRRGLLFVENLDEALKVIGLVDDGIGGEGGKATPADVYVIKSNGGQNDTVWESLRVEQHVEPIDVPKTTTMPKAKLSLPPPPSATPSQGLPSVDDTDQGGEEPQEKKIPERSGFARFFGRPGASSAKTHRSPEQAEATAQGGTLHAPDPIPAPRPFAQHYIQTASLDVELGSVRLSPSSPWSLAHGTFTTSKSRQGDDTTGSSSSVRKRTRFKDAGSDSESETVIYPGTEEESQGKGSRNNKPKKGRGGAGDKDRKSASTTVSLSVMLDNVVILEEAIKEIVAILQVRRALGIDPIQFV